jgi:SdiA-regulated
MKIAIYFMAFLLFVSCKSHSKNENKSLAISHLEHFDFSKPNDIIVLPKELKEISGISLINDSLVAAISDAKPFLFIYNLNQRKILDQIEIEGAIDLEDIIVIRNDAYALQSNGKLWKIGDYLTKPIIQSYILQLDPPFELEGLCANQTSDSLFFAAKFWRKKGENKKSSLPVWAYSIKEKELNISPIFSIQTGIASKKKEHLFHTSAILQLNAPLAWVAVSTNEKFIAEFGENGNLVKIIPLDQEVFTQPEGITIDKEGNIYISNEGKNGDKATILKFEKNKSR